MAVDLQGEITALVQEMQNLEKALEDTGALVASSSAKLQQIETNTAALLVAASNAVGHHEDDLGALGKQAQTLADQLKTEIEQGTQVILTEAAEVTSVAGTAFAAVDAAKASVGHLADAASQHTNELTAALQQFSELIKQVEGALTARIQAMGEGIQHGVSEITDLEHNWTQLGESTAHAIGDALHKTSDEIDQKFIAPLEEGVKQFQDLTKRIEDEVLSNPVGALADQLKNTILTAAQHEIDDLAQQLQKLIDGAVQNLTDAGGGNDAVTKEIKAIFQELEPVWNQLTDALRSVQSIWDTVKNAVSVL